MVGRISPVFPSVPVLSLVLFHSPALPCKCSWSNFFPLLWDGKGSLECQFASSAVQPGEINSSARPLFLLCMCPALDPRLFSLALVTPNELQILSVISLFPPLRKTSQF